MKLDVLFDSIRSKRIDGELSTKEITKITQDTREVTDGDVFVCVSGAAFDGHAFAQQAIDKGAIAIVAEKPVDVKEGHPPIVYVSDTRKVLTILAATFYGRPSEELSVIGVTGTNGKTTITHLINHILKIANKKTGLIGTIGMEVDGERLPVKNTTPDNITLQRTMRMMVERDVDVCSMEVSSHALVQGRTWGVDIDVAVLSNLTHEHLDFHKTMEEYQHAKSLLFSQLGNAPKNGRLKVAILNKDDATFDAYRTATAAEVWSYSVVDETADFFAQNISYTKEGASFELVFAGKTYPVETNLMGTFNVSNALAALASVYAIGIPIEEAIANLQSARTARGRLQALTSATDIQVYNDFAHTPDGLENALNAVRPTTTGKIRLVLGVMGDRDKKKRPIMGRIATELADWTIFTMESPESEQQADITAMLVAEANRLKYEVIEDRREAIKQAILGAEKGDTIIIAGRGHEQSIRIGETVLHFDDEEVANEMIALRNESVK